MTERYEYQWRGRNYAVYLVRSWYDPETQNTKKKKRYLGMAQEKGGEWRRKHVGQRAVGEKDALVYLLSDVVMENQGDTQSTLTSSEWALLRQLATYYLVHGGALDKFPEWAETHGNSSRSPQIASGLQDVKATTEQIGEKLKRSSTLPQTIDEPENTIVVWYPAPLLDEPNRANGQMEYWDGVIREMFSKEAIGFSFGPFPRARLIVGNANTGRWRLWLAHTLDETSIPHLNNVNVMRVYDAADPKQSTDSIQHAIKRRRKQPTGVVGGGEAIGQFLPLFGSNVKTVAIPGTSQRLCTNGHLGDETLAKRMGECRKVKHLTDAIWKWMSGAMGSVKDSREYRQSLAYASARIAMVAFRAQKVVVDAVRESKRPEDESWEDAWNLVHTWLNGVTGQIYRNGSVELDINQDHYDDLVQHLGVGCRVV